MSSYRLSRASLRAYRNPHDFAQALGNLVRHARNFDGRPIEELAPLAGLTVQEWLAIEAGEGPYAFECILMIANWALRCSPKWLAYAQQLYKGTCRERQ